MNIGVSADAPHVTERLPHRLAKRNADILGGMVMVDMQIAGRLDVDVDPGVAGEEIKHVIEKADPGRDRRSATTVEVDRDCDVGFLGGSFDRCLAHGVSGPNPRPKARVPQFACLVSGVARSRHCRPRHTINRSLSRLSRLRRHVAKPTHVLRGMMPGFALKPLNA
jgi:hypothetical protein